MASPVISDPACITVELASSTHEAPSVFNRKVSAAKRPPRPQKLEAPPLNLQHSLRSHVGVSEDLPGLLYVAENWWASMLAFAGTVTEQIYLRWLLVMVVAVICNALWPWALTASPGIANSYNTVGHTIMGTVLSLILGFRTNASYDRFWEGRKAWGTLMNSAKTFGRILGPNTHTTKHGDHFLHLLVAYMILLKNRLRRFDENRTISAHTAWEEESAELKEYLSPALYCHMAHVHNRPMALLRVLSDWVRTGCDSGKVDKALFATLEGLIKELSDQGHVCERIVTTLVPLPYMVQVCQCVFLFVITLPGPFQPLFPVWTSLIPTAVVAYGFLGLEEAGRMVENPFGTDVMDLPLDLFCAAIEDDLMMLFHLTDNLNADAENATVPLEDHCGSRFNAIASKRADPAEALRKLILK